MTPALKTKAVATTVGLILVGAAGFYMFGTGGRLDTSNDRRIIATVSWDPSARTLPVKIVVLISGMEQGTHNRSHSPWTEGFWLRPGEGIAIQAQQRTEGTLTCSMTVDGKPLLPNTAHTGPGAICAISTVA